MYFSRPLLLLGLIALTACETQQTTASVKLPATAAPANATVLVQTPGRLKRELSRDMLCTPSPDVQSRGQAAIAEIDRRVGGVDPSLPTEEFGQRTFEIWNDVGQETGCWLDGFVYAGTASASVEVGPGELALHQYRDPGTMGVPTGATANCMRLPGQTEEEARAVAQSAARARLSEFDAIQTAFEALVVAEGSAAFQMSNNLEEINASRDAINARFNCTSVFLDYPVVR